MSTLSTPTTRRASAADGVGGATAATTRAARPAADASSTHRGHVRPFLRRWVTAAMLLGAATLATLYIANAIAVNDLLGDITSLEHERDLAQTENEKLRAELLRLMSVERVTTLGRDRLGLVQPAQPPQELLPTPRAADEAQGAASAGNGAHDSTADGEPAADAAGR